MTHGSAPTFCPAHMHARARVHLSKSTMCDVIPAYTAGDAGSGRVGRWPSTNRNGRARSHNTFLRSPFPSLDPSPCPSLFLARNSPPPPPLFPATFFLPKRCAFPSPAESRESRRRIKDTDARYESRQTGLVHRILGHARRELWRIPRAKRKARIHASG